MNGQHSHADEVTIEAAGRAALVRADGRGTGCAGMRIAGRRETGLACRQVGLPTRRRTEAGAVEHCAQLERREAD